MYGFGSDGYYNSNIHADSDCIANTHSTSDGIANTHSTSDGIANTHSTSDCIANTDSRSDGIPDADTDSLPNCIADFGICADIDSIGSAHGWRQRCRRTA